MLIEELPSIQQRQINIFKKKNINTVDDLMNYTPRKYIDYRQVRNIRNCLHESYAAVAGTLVGLEKRPLKGTSREYLYIKLLQDDQTPITCMMFNNVYKFHDYMELYQTPVVLCGKVSISPLYGYSIQNPDDLQALQSFHPYIKRIYTKLKGMTDKTFENLLLEGLAETEEPLEPEVIERDKLLAYPDALYDIHFPTTEQDVMNGKKRLVYNNMLYFAMSLQTDKSSKLDTDKLMIKTDLLNIFAKSLPFRLTQDQHTVIQTMLNNAKAGKRNNVLLQGDVGCGKTVVAASMMVLAADNGYQSVLMAPRSVLAQQHYEEIRGYAESIGKTCVFLHSKLKAKERREILKKIANGEADFIIGTHSCFATDVTYHNLALIITDEEHLFGVEQKRALFTKAEDGVHTISMSATPIPRTLCDVIYGNAKEVLSIKQKPAGRKEIITRRIQTRQNIFEHMEKEIRDGHRCYVVCPAIEDDEDGMLTSIDTVSKEYAQYFSPKGISIGILNGKMKAEEIEETVQSFVNGSIQILISTTVIEVGVNVPNATIIVIEQAERFGLASLHQLRGRVGRSELQSFCYLISEDPQNQRLHAMEKTNDGFEIAEADLRQRGGGNLIGTQQSGFNQFLAEVIQYPKMYHRVQETAEYCLENGYGKKLMEIYQENLEQRECSKQKKSTKKGEKD